jgi:hypothetical protein
VNSIQGTTNWPDQSEGKPKQQKNTFLSIPSPLDHDFWGAMRV